MATPSSPEAFHAFFLSSAASSARRTWLLGAVAAGIAPLLMPVDAATDSRGKVSLMIQLATLPYRLYSAPVAWAVPGTPGLSWAAVFGTRQGSTTVPFIAGFDGRNAPLPGFPWLRSLPMTIAPGHSLLAAAPNGQLAAIDVEGRLRLFGGGAEIGSPAPISPILSVVATLPVPMGGRSEAMVLLSRDSRPHTESQNSIALMIGRQLAPGSPLPLSGIPETQPPVVDAQSSRVYVMLRTGQVDGFDLVTAKRLQGYPTPAPARDSARPPGGFRLALLGDGPQLLVTTGLQGQLQWLSGSTVRTLKTGVRRFEALVSVPGGVVAWDAATGSLVMLDAAGQELGDLPLVPGFGAQAPQLVAHRGTVFAVGLEATDPAGRVDQLFAQSATADEQAEVVAIAEEENELRFGSRKPAGLHEPEARAGLTRLKKSWLERKYGLGPLSKAIHDRTSTRIVVALGFGNGRPEVVRDDSVPGFTPETGFQQCEHVLPVVWRDPQNGKAFLIVGLNETASEQSAVRIYALDT
jgi:hypothetical protein